jgi:Zn-finger nucleic acid-binding protein
MATCKNCSAPMPANSNCCQYCGVRNDVDLQNKHDYTVQTQQSERICPVCHIPLQTIDLKVNGHLYIEHCQTCFGLFFDPGEIETLLDSSVSGVLNVNWQLIDNINQERYPTGQKVKYVKCPVCQMLMDRVNFGYRSGVVVDQCRAHGIWLDSGEISHLMEWKKAGGQLWNQQKEQQSKSEAENIDYPKVMRSARLTQSRPYFDDREEPDLLNTLSSLVFNLFR